MALGLLTMELTNLTMNGGGTYTCMATSERASRSDHIILNILEKVEGTILYPEKEWICVQVLYYTLHNYIHVHLNNCKCA